MAKKTNTPPCGAWLVTEKAIVMPPVTPAPTTDAGITRSGSEAAKGIAPSEMNAAPSSQAALPFSFSAWEKMRGRTAVANAMARGGTIPAAMTVAMISHGTGFSTEPAASPATANEYATLLTGPPRSTAIMVPRMSPRMTAAVPVIELSQESRPLVRALIGPPRTMNISPEETREATSGMMTTGMSPRSHLGAAKEPIQWAM